MGVARTRTARPTVTALEPSVGSCGSWCAGLRASPGDVGDRRAVTAASWKTTAHPQWRQVAYEIQVIRGDQTESSGRVESSESVLVPWPTAPLSSRERANARVRVWGLDDVPSAWSPPASVEAGLLDPSDWLAGPVGPAWYEDPASGTRRPPLLRRQFVVRGRPAKARLYVTAHGLFEIESMASEWDVTPWRRGGPFTNRGWGTLHMT
jgi:alpha-L-rhamnosidase